MFRVSFQAMGTACEVAYSSPTAREAELFRREVMAWVDGFEKRYSRYLPDSLVGRVNAAAGRESVEVNEEDLHLLDLCDGLHFLTEGLFDPTTLPLSLLWDFKARDPQVPDEGRIASALHLVGWKKVVREGNRIFLPEEGMGLDFGGFGKEYAVDRALEMAMARANPPELHRWQQGWGSHLRGNGKRDSLVPLRSIGCSLSLRFLDHDFMVLLWRALLGMAVR